LPPPRGRDGCDYVIVARAELARAPFGEIKAELAGALRRIHDGRPRRAPAQVPQRRRRRRDTDERPGRPMTQDNKNLFLAFGLSLLVMIGWNYFYGAPQLEKARQEQIEAQRQAAQPEHGAVPNSTAPKPSRPAAAPGAAPNVAAPAVGMSRAEAVAANPRVALQTRSLSGSIALRGARINDVALNNYRETVDKASPKIELLSPSRSPHPFYAEFGFVGQPGANIALPGADTMWTADAGTLGADKPVTLSWDNGQGLIFRRQIAVDDNYMFKVTDTVENRGAEPVTLFPYALISRHGLPQTSGYYILHEGLIGVFGDKGLQEVGYAAIETARAQTFKARGAWLGITDKYWAAALIPDQNVETDSSFKFFQSGTTKSFQTTHVFAGAKEAHVDAYSDGSSASTSSTA
jgi:YidC/Oxa1 family membrane protein insertase